MIMAEDLQQVYGQALEAHEQEEYVRAVELYDRILQQHPDADLVLYNYGLALYQLGRFGEAVRAFSQAAEIRQDDADTWFNLGLALKQDTKFAEARCAYERALELHEDEDVLFNLANCCREDGAVEQAAISYEQLLQHFPDHISGLNNYAYLCHRLGEYSKAEELYRRLLFLRPDHSGALHMLAALNGSAETTPASDYVRDLFDQYSDSFEQSLVEKLEYRVPELLAADLTAYDGLTVFRNCVDLGCGTGLAGAVFRSRCAYLCGVDLSRNMVELAADKQLYDQLSTGDVVQFLIQDEQQYDLFVAADLLTYLADLEPLFQSVATRSRQNGLFVFSTEKGSVPGWQVRPTGRFAHHQDYVTEVVQKLGAQVVSCQEENLRKEGEDWVRGELYIVRFTGVE